MGSSLIYFLVIRFVPVDNRTLWEIARRMKIVEEDVHLETTSLIQAVSMSTSVRVVYTLQKCDDRKRTVSLPIWGDSAA